MKVETLVVGPLETNCYILYDDADKNALVIDPGAEYGRIKKFLDKKNLMPQFILHTHGHADHIAADGEFSLPVYIHRKDLDLLQDAKLNLSQFLGSPLAVKNEIKTLEDGEDIYLGSQKCLKVIHTPGHTPGSISLLLSQPKNKIVFTGDALFYEGIGRTDFPGASSAVLIESIRSRLLTLDDGTLVYPGHGQSTSIGHERRNNPFLN